MFSSYLRLLSTQRPRQFTPRFTRSFFSKKPEPANEPQANTVRPRRNILPIMTYDGQGPTNGYFISLMNASDKSGALAQLEGCDYTITHEFPENYAFFSGKFDANALQILRTSPYVRGISERYPIRAVWEDEELV